MPVPMRRRGAAAGLCVSAVAIIDAGAHAPRAETIVLPDIVVTATRTERAAAETGTAITVINAEEIEKSSARSVDDLLRRVPGVSLTQSGGPGQVQTVRIRGGDVRHTLVLIDGVRVNDPSSTGREFDFATLVLANIERIEVLRGPQSALYGSDAMGGVINIITRRGQGAPKTSLSVEGGSYGTKEIKGGVAGGDERIDYAFGFTGLDTAGFSAFGYRIGRLRYLAPSPAGFEPDSARRFGLNGRVGVTIADGVRAEVGGNFSHNRAQYDAAFFPPPFPDTPSLATSDQFNGYAKLIADALGGTLRHTVTLYGNRIDREFKDFTFGDGAIFCRDTFFVRPKFLTCQVDTDFQSRRTGAQYQGDLRLGTLGLISFGAQLEQDHAVSGAERFVPAASPRTLDFAGTQTTRSLFALYQTTIGQRLHLSLGGRIDDVLDVARFDTWRATAAYDLAETGTILRASAGTGGKAPSLYQLFGPFGTPTLEPERSFGADVGIDQRLFDGRAKLSASFFVNRYRDLIDFDFNVADCRPSQFFGCYFNVARARIWGVEAAGEVVLVPDLIRVRLTYTRLHAIDAATGLELARRPPQEGRIGLALTPTPGWLIEPSVVLVDRRFNFPNEAGRLAPYARLDLYTSYKLDETFSLFGRGENLTNAHYQEVLNYGTAGRSFYGGIRAIW